MFLKDVSAPEMHSEGRALKREEAFQRNYNRGHTNVSLVEDF